MCCTKRSWPGFGWGKTVHVCSLGHRSVWKGLLGSMAVYLNRKNGFNVLALTGLYLTGLSKEKRFIRLDLETKANADTEVNG